MPTDTASKTERADALAMVAQLLAKLPTDDIERIGKLVKNELKSRTILNDLTNEVMSEGK